MSRLQKIFGIIIYSVCNLAWSSGEWSVSLGAGNASYEASPFPGGGCCETSFNARGDLRFLSLGRDINRHFSLEIGYIDLGNVADRIVPEIFVSLRQDTLTLDVSGMVVNGTVTWRLHEFAALSGKIGWSILDVDKRWSGGTWVDPVRQNDVGGREAETFWGVRLKSDVSDSYSVSLNWDRYKVADIDVDGAYIAVAVRF